MERGLRARASTSACLALAIVAASGISGGLRADAAHSDPVLVGAGDIATCGNNGDEQTAALLDGIAGTVYTTGDNAYTDGTATQYRDCYDPSWGRHRARTKPSPGNHERDGDGYTSYFDGILDPEHPFWYSYDLGSWHIVSLDSDCGDHRESCGWDSKQLRWLRADLAATDQACVAAYWHHPRFSSGDHGSNTEVASLWRALSEADADVVLNGHDHLYERFGKQDGNANADPGGIREFVVGTGGASSYKFRSPERNSQVRITDSVGVLKLTLHANSYDWRFITPQGDADAGSDICNGPGPAPARARVKATLRSIADANLYAESPNRRGGAGRILYPDGAPVTRSLIKFNASKLDGEPVAATLWLWVNEGSRNGPLVRRSSSSWRESKVTWSSRPPLTSSALDDLGAIDAGRWVSFNVSRAVTSGGVITFAVIGTGRDGSAFASRETHKDPQLVVTVLREHT